MSKIQIPEWITKHYGPVSDHHYWSRGFRHKDNAYYLQNLQVPYGEGYNVRPDELLESPKDKDKDGYIATGTTISEPYGKQVLRHIVKKGEKLKKDGSGFTQENLNLLREEIKVYNDTKNGENLNPNYEKDGIYLSRGDRFYSMTGMTIDRAKALLRDRDQSRSSSPRDRDDRSSSPRDRDLGQNRGRSRTQSRGRFQSPSPPLLRLSNHRTPKGGSRRRRSKSQNRNRRRTRRH